MAIKDNLIKRKASQKKSSLDDSHLGYGLADRAERPTFFGGGDANLIKLELSTLPDQMDSRDIYGVSSLPFSNDITGATKHYGSDFNFQPKNVLDFFIESNEASNAKELTESEVHRPENISTYSSNIKSQNWVCKESYSGKILDTYEDSVLVEMVIDKENFIIEERELELSLFDNIDLSRGTFVKIRRYVRPNATMIQIQDGKGLVFEDDFPKRDFSKFKNSKMEF